MNILVRKATLPRDIQNAKKTEHSDNESLAHWAANRKQGATLVIKQKEEDPEHYALLRKLKGYVRIDNKWKLYAIHHPDRIEFLHCGEFHSFSQGVES